MQRLRHTHLFTHQTISWRWTCFIGSNVRWKRHTDIFYVCNVRSWGKYCLFVFYNNRLHCSIRPLQQEASSTLGLRQTAYLKHPPVSCDCLHGFLFLSELVGSSSDFDQAGASRSRLTGTSLLAMKGHAGGVSTGRNGDYAPVEVKDIPLKKKKKNWLGNITCLSCRTFTVKADCVWG